MLVLNLALETVNLYERENRESAIGRSTAGSRRAASDALFMSDVSWLPRLRNTRFG